MVEFLHAIIIVGRMGVVYGRFMFRDSTTWNEDGINNKVGKLNEETVFEILDIAISKDIKVIDTASIYGEAEEILTEKDTEDLPEEFVIEIYQFIGEKSNTNAKNNWYNVREDVTIVE